MPISSSSYEGFSTQILGADELSLKCLDEETFNVVKTIMEGLGGDVRHQLYGKFKHKFEDCVSILCSNTLQPVHLTTHNAR